MYCLYCFFFFLNTTFSFRFVRFVTFRSDLDAEMKEAMRIGVTLKTKGDEKEAVNNEEEELFFYRKDYLDSHQLGRF